MSYKSVWDFGRAGKANYSVHTIGDYPSKIRPIVIRKIVERFSKKGDIILDPFCGSGTVAVEAKLQGRNSINYDINPIAIELTKRKLSALDQMEMQKAYMELIEDCKKELRQQQRKMEKISLEKELKKLQSRLEEIQSDGSIACNTKHIVEVRDARKLDLADESVDSVITDIPYANMIQYTNLEKDLSILKSYELFLEEITKAFREIWRVLKRGKYCVIFAADYRVGASRKIFPVHSDVIQAMRNIGFTLFDEYIWRYYRSGGFRPFGKPPYQAMNVHIYILCFYKPVGDEEEKPNRPIRYRKRLIEKIKGNCTGGDLFKSKGGF